MSQFLQLLPELVWHWIAELFGPLRLSVGLSIGPPAKVGQHASGLVVGFWVVGSGVERAQQMAERVTRSAAGLARERGLDAGAHAGMGILCRRRVVRDGNIDVLLPVERIG